MLPRRFSNHGLAEAHADMVTCAGISSEARFAPRNRFDAAPFLVREAKTIFAEEPVDTVLKPAELLEVAEESKTSQAFLITP